MAQERVELLDDDQLAQGISRDADEYDQIDATQRIIEIEKSSTDNKYDHLQYKPSTESSTCCPTTFADKLITSVYVLCILTALIMTGLYFATDESMQQFLSLIIVCVSTWVGVAVAIIAIGQGYTTKDTVADLKKKNNEYHNKLQGLSKQREKLLAEAHELKQSTLVLHEEEKQLSESVAGFGELSTEFSKLKDYFGQSWNTVSDTMNKSQGIMKTIEKQKHRAKLFTKYYEFASQDDKDGLSQSEWDEFLELIDPEYSEAFKKLKFDFDNVDTDGDQNISTQEFEAAVVQVLDKLGQNDDSDHSDAEHEP